MDYTVKYSVHANPLKDGDGRTTYQVRQDTYYTLDTEELLRHMHSHQLLSIVPLKAVLEALRQEIAERLLSNFSLRLTGLGTFYLNIGLKPLTDEAGREQRRVVTDPAQITGNDLMVTGLGFTPDKEFQDMVTRAGVSFVHTAPRGTVGHSSRYTAREMEQGLREYLAGGGHMTRREFQSQWHLTYYAARQWLNRLCSGPAPLLRRSSVGGTFLYRLNVV